jgi:hypothetical protein
MFHASVNSGHTSQDTNQHLFTPPRFNNDQPRFIDETVEGFSSKKTPKNHTDKQQKKIPNQISG